MSPFTSAPADDQPWYRKSWRHPIFRMLRPFHYCDTESHPTSTHAHRVTGLSSLSSVEAAWENHRLADFDEWFPGSQSLVHIFLRGLLKTLCIVYCGQPDLKIIFDATTQTEFVWRDAKDQYGERLNTINIIGGLLLGAIATFVTSNPPQTAMFDYNQRGPYICLLACFGLTLGNLIVGSALSYGLSLATPTWYRETFLGSPSRICCTLVLLSYPFLSIGMATSVGALGLLIAAWNSSDEIIRSGGTYILVVPTSMGLLFLWTQIILMRSRKPVNSCGNNVPMAQTTIATVVNQNTSHRANVTDTYNSTS